MTATEISLVQFLRDNRDHKLLIPIYQRSYEWTTKKDKEVYTLWQNISDIDILDENSTHFINSIVYIADEKNTNFLNIIDGQQRITTISILFIAIRNRLEKLQKDKKLQDLVDEIKIVKEQIEEFYLIRKWKKGDDKIRLSLSNKNRDREIFNKLAVDIDEPSYSRSDQDSNLIKAYKFFKTTEKIGSMSFDDIKSLLFKIERIFIVKVALEIGKDNPQIVFSSLNGGGLKLKDTDLIKNTIFMKLERDDQEFLHSNKWEVLEESILEKDFSIFFSHFLTMKLGRVVTNNSIYDEFVKKYFDKIPSNSEFNKVKFVLDEMLFYKDIFLDLKSGNIFNNLSILPLFDIEAYYPFLMKLKAEQTPFFTKIVRIIESYLVRRFIYGLQPNATKLVFANACKDIAINENIIVQFESFLKKKDAKQRFPNDEEFISSLKNKSIYDDSEKLTKAILFALEKTANPSLTFDVVNFNKYTVEHILPQNSYENLNSCWKNNFNKDEHSKYLHLLGNLTLLFSDENSTAKDFCFEQKKQVYNESELYINNHLLDFDNWTKITIENYSNYLVKLALERWKRLDETPGN
jgi:uncharacterized protein with ParB-like and HNH nuclease domain